MALEAMGVKYWLDIGSIMDGSGGNFVTGLRSGLGRFHLPRFTRFPLGRKHCSLGPYIAKANGFFSYTMFLDAREREKASKAIDKIIEVMGAGEDPGLRLDEEDVRGPYTADTAFLAGLKNYILSEDRADRDRLMGCDFVTIIDKILKFRKQMKVN